MDGVGASHACEMSQMQAQDRCTHQSSEILEDLVRGAFGFVDEVLGEEDVVLTAVAHLLLWRSR